MTSRIVSPLTRLAAATKNWSLVQRFTVASFIIMVLGMAGIGWWIGEQIEAGVIKESTAATALYMDSFIAPNLQELGQSDVILQEHIDALNDLFSASNLGRRTVSIKIWNKDGRIIYSNIPALLGRVFPNNTDLVEPFNGEVTGGISNLQDAENIEERRLSSDPLLEVYSPVRLNDTNEIIAVAEFYQKVDTLEAEIAAARRIGWLILAATMMLMYLLLIGFVRFAADRIDRQELELKKQVEQLKQSLMHNKELSGRVRLAAANATALNESILRRTSAELHDGPVQEISLALLRLDRAMAQNETCRLVYVERNCNEMLPVIQTLLQTGLQEMRSIAGSLGIPRLDGLTLAEVIRRAVVSHEQRTGTSVALKLNDLPEHASLPIKITAYRLVQEALNNASRHAGGVGQEVRVTAAGDRLEIEVLDRGPGFEVSRAIEQDEHLGLAGMRERVESLGGFFAIESKINEGTRLFARLALQNPGGSSNG
jgi:signal transduction histidine kinase